MALGDKITAWLLVLGGLMVGIGLIGKFILFLITFGGGFNG